ncbi:hypothetical protein [Phenylobacterium sp.]|uniref:hypothetical protein n=1 Tax=Phenylobacterium sp. TaxID=1871053 RepID=UPI002FCB84B4
MRFALFYAASALLIGNPVQAQSPLEQGFAGALRGCEEWVLNPKSWASGVAPFVSTVGLGDKMGLVARVDETSLPPKPLRAANRYWRINSTPGAGYVLVVSDQLPMCHVTGGGDTDLQPVVESVLDANAFASRWEKSGEEANGDLITTVFRNREEPAFSILVSRAKAPGQRLDRVQVVATATYKMAQ